MLSQETVDTMYPYPSAQQPSAGLIGVAPLYPMAQQPSAGIMGFGGDILGQPFPGATTGMVVGGSLLGGAVTMLVFAGAFYLARTERVWWPSILIGGVTALAGLTRAAMR